MDGSNTYIKNEGEWIEALLLGLEHYAFIHADDVVIDSNDDEDVADTNNNDDNLVGLNNITNSPVKTKMDDRIIADLLMDYVEISLSEDLTSSLNNNSSSSSSRRRRRDLQHQGQHGPTHIVCEVCMDYCTTIKRNDLLFGPIYERFVNTNQEYIFLELLEKYIFYVIVYITYQQLLCKILYHI